jgi:hypothetical protein
VSDVINLAEKTGRQDMITPLELLRLAAEHVESGECEMEGALILYTTPQGTVGRYYISRMSPSDQLAALAVHQHLLLNRCVRPVNDQEP